MVTATCRVFRRPHGRSGISEGTYLYGKMPVYTGICPGPFSHAGYFGFGHPSSRRRVRRGCRGSAATSRAALKADARRAALSNHRKGACACRIMIGTGTARGGSTRSRETAEGSAYSASTGIYRVFTIPTVYTGIYPSRFAHAGYLSTHI